MFRSPQIAQYVPFHWQIFAPLSGTQVSLFMWEDDFPWKPNSLAFNVECVNALQVTQEYKVT